MNGIIIDEHFDYIFQVFEYVNSCDECLFVAYMGSNFNYISINAFIQKLHYEYGFVDFSGIIINTRNDINYGHTFESDSFRFPDFCKVTVIHLANDIIQRNLTEKIRMLIGGIYRRIKYKEDNHKFFVLTQSPDIKQAIMACYYTKREVHNVVISSGAAFATFWTAFPIQLKEQFNFIMERIIVKNVMFFRPFNYRMKRDYEVERYFKNATESENLDILGANPNEAYLIYVSQSYAYGMFNDVVEQVLEKKRKDGYRIYIKPHTHEREAHYPQSNDYVILPKGYALESIVAGTKRKPDMMLGFSSTTFFSCSAWYGVKCYSLLSLVSKEKWKKDDFVFERIINKGYYPDLWFYSEDSTSGVLD